MPRGQYDRDAARARREAESTNGKAEAVSLRLIDFLQDTFDLELTAENVIAVHTAVQEALAE